LMASADAGLGIANLTQLPNARAGILLFWKNALTAGPLVWPI
jgi:hypothetical protein